MGDLDRAIVLYLLGKLREAHPFRLSRLLLLLDLERLKANGKRITGFRYVFMPAGFYIDGFPAFLESLPGVEKVVVRDDEGHPVRGFFRLTREADVDLPPELRRTIDRLLEETEALDDQELNRLALDREEYAQLLRGTLPGWE